MSKTAFALDSSLVDLNNLSVGNFFRPSVVYLEKIVDENLLVYPIESSAPAIDSETSAFLLEPLGLNYVTWNMDLTKNLYQKGSNIVIQADEVLAPDSSYLADRLVWLPFTGDPQAQIFRRPLKLNAATTHTLSAILKLESGRFTSSDVIRVVGGVIGTPSISLSLLNDFPKRYRLLQLTFVTAGQEPKLPNNPHQAGDYAVTAVTSNTVTISISATVAQNDLVGGQVYFTNLANTFFNITANTATSAGSVTITLNTTNLSGQGITTASRAVLQVAAKQDVNIEFYSQSSAVLNWGGLQVEDRPFRTSIIFQAAEIVERSAATLVYRNSPIANLRTFGVFVDLKFWRGDGNLFDFGNFRGYISQGRLYIQAGSTVISTPDLLPTENVKIFAQVSEETTSLSLFVNSVLKAKTSIFGFTADLTASLTLTSEGVRCFQRFLTTDALVLDGNPTVGNFATDEVADFFSNPVIVDATAISAHAPLINLNPVTVPGKEQPIAKSRINAINSSTRTITLADNTDFSSVMLTYPISIWRGDYLVTRANATNFSGSDIVLDTVAGIVIGDELRVGNVDRPGKASVRFPWDPIDQQAIISVNEATGQLKVASVLSFARKKAFIISPLYEDKAEVLITSIDTTNNFLFVTGNVSGLRIGDIIAQPLNEMLVDRENYLAGILNYVNGVSIARKYSNGIVLENTNPFPVIVRPYIRIYL